MSLLELNLMGVPEVILDGEPVVFARRGSVALLAYLALSRRAHPRETLATLLAGDSSEEQARKYLSNVLVDLRQRIGGYVRATRQTVAFDRSLPHRLDVQEFQAALRAGQEDEASAGLERAVTLYRDEFLAGLTLSGAPDFEAWLFAEREDLRSQYMQALRADVDAAIRRCDWAQGIPSVRRLIAEEPWLEDAHLQLMLMLARSGQRQAAIAQYQTCRRVLREELGVDPSPATTSLFHRLRAAVTPPPHNVPTPTGPMVGRAQELRLITELLVEPDRQLVTIAGLGGSGKTRLALEVARGFTAPSSLPAEQPFPDGVIFVSLAECGAGRGQPTGPTLLGACASALGLPMTGSENELRQHVLAYVQPRALLLVLDNVEPLHHGAAEVERLVNQAPHLKVLATTRSPLHLAGERVLHVDGLSVPASPAELEEAPASALFLQEAGRVQLGFSLPDDQRPYLMELCQLLGGFPLALVLAARWAPLLPCSEMLRELGSGLDVLATTEADLPERHRSLAAILDSALDRLSSDERALAQRLAETPTRPPQPRTLTEMLPGLRVLREQALVRVDGTSGIPQLHPLVQRHVRAGPRGRACSARVA